MHTIDALLDRLTEDAPVRRVLVGAFWTAVELDTDPPRCGLASTLRGAGHHHRPPIPEAGRLLTYSGRELAQWLHADHVMATSIGMAAYNALNRLSMVDEAACTEVNAENVILERGGGRQVAIVGHFPFVDRVREAAATCWVLELVPRPGDLAAERADEILPQADVVALTGTSLLNHTFDELMAHCRPDAFVLALGPSTPFSPMLFETGVDGLSGTIVTDPTRVLRSVEQGATFRQIKRAGGLRLLTLYK